MRIIRLIGNLCLWLCALLGILAGAVWGAGQLGLLQPLIVVSGSMEPEIMTGDLLIDRPIRTSTVEVGDILSLPSELTGKLVTHRVVSIERSGADGAWEIRMHGDANAEPDLEPYTVGDEVLTPVIQVPMAGKVVSKLMEPSVAVPILIALVALLGVSLLDEEPRTKIRRSFDRAGRGATELDALDRELAAVGVDMAQFEQRDDSICDPITVGVGDDHLDALDRELAAVGVDVARLDPPERVRATWIGEDEEPAAASHTDRTREPALTG